jgi:hypothetical protein
MTELDKRLMAFKHFNILEVLLEMCDKYEINHPDHKLAYGKSALVFQNITNEKCKNGEQKKLRRILVEKSINSIVNVLTTIEGEGKLSKLDKEEFDEICSQLLEGEELKSNHIKKGKMVLCDDLAYQITDIDFDDFTIRLEDFDSGVKFWEKPTSCKKV